MKKRMITGSMIWFLIVLFAAIFFWNTKKVDTPINEVELNDLLMTIEENFPKNQSKLADLCEKYGAKLSVCIGDEIYYKSDKDAPISRSNVLKCNGYTQLLDNGYTVYIDRLEQQVKKQQEQSTIVLFLIALTGILVWVIAVLLFLKRHMITPFQKMKTFAKEVAAGNLEFPLPMDRYQNFGAFTESFDLMREQLKEARQLEREARQSKEALVASLSHDVKTPLASIKATAELLMALEQDSSKKEKEQAVYEKAEQMELLVENLFQTSLEGLEQLEVSPVATPSTILESIIKQADYENKVQNVTIQPCMVLIDELRIKQVVDNVIANSYKYAKTAITVTSEIMEEHLVLTITDFGPGVEPLELYKILKQYYRGANSKGKPGAGIGLFMAHSFMEKMNGTLTVENGNPGLIVRLVFAFA